jgi:hypothetical protein
MKRTSFIASVCGAALLAAASVTQAQQAGPRLSYVLPAGGRQGTTFEVAVGGQYLQAVNQAYVSGLGAKVEIREHLRPLNQQEANQLRERVQELLKKPDDPEARKEIAEIRRKLAAFQRRPAPAVSELVTLEVTLAPDAPPGPRELRLAAPAGVSNPLRFYVNQLPEFTRPALKPGETVGELGAFRAGSPGATPPGPTVRITLPAILNGQVLPGGVERYRFAATKGLHLVVAAKARDLIPYIADAVPGWFQAAITLYEAKDSGGPLSGPAARGPNPSPAARGGGAPTPSGARSPGPRTSELGRELAFADHFRYSPDPILRYDIPRDGDYILEVRDTLYRGREDFVYRIALGELPFITGIFPLGGRAGSRTPVEVLGWNLPATTLVHDATGRAPGVYPLSLPDGVGVTNGVLFAVDDLREVMERKPNGSLDCAQPLTLPVIVNGRVERAGEWSCFRFEGRKGQELVAEVRARRLGSPLDSVLALLDAAGKQVALSDDCVDTAAGLITHHADSSLRATLPADGAYYLRLGDVQGQAGPEYAYRLRVSAPQPDFELRATPSSVSVRGGGSAPLTVRVIRREGFAGPIELALTGAPPGFTRAGGRVPPRQDQVRITISAPPVPPPIPVSLTIEGRATVEGREVVRPVVPAEDMMQAFAWRHLVPSQELAVHVTGRLASMPLLGVLGPMPVRIPAGGTVHVQVGLPPRFDGVQLTLNEPPEGISLRGVTPAGQGLTMLIASDAAKVKPGLAGNLIVNASAQPRIPATGSTRPAASQRRIPLGVLPAIPFEVVAAPRS